MTVDKARVSRRFGRSATTYDRYASVQRRMADRLLEGVERVAPRPAAILEVGCGTGYLTQLLCRAFPVAHVTAVDLSSRMADVAKARLDGADVTLLVGDAEDRPWGDETFDLVVSNAALQWLVEPARTIALLASSLRPGGAMSHATFGPGTFEELHRVFREVETARGLRARLHGLDLRPAAEWAELLRDCGLEDVGWEAIASRVEYPDCRAFLESVKRTGSNSGPTDAAFPPVSREALLEVLGRYDRAARTASGVYATYELIEIVGRKAGDASPR